MSEREFLNNRALERAYDDWLTEDDIVIDYPEEEIAPEEQGCCNCAYFHQIKNVCDLDSSDYYGTNKVSICNDYEPYKE